ncbi:MAG: ATP-binding protein [Pseudomonadales bacterium]|nr:ATP-binding protein [Pseudomonadales bacterium]
MLVTDSKLHLNAAKDWLTNYYINFVAIIGPLIGMLTLYRVIYTEDITISLLPLSLAMLPWPIIAWFKHRIDLQWRMILVVFFFMSATLLVTVHRGLHSHIMLLGPIASLTLMLFYGKRGFWIATVFLLALLVYATSMGLIYGHVAAISLEDPMLILYRGVTMGMLAITFIYSIFGVTTILGKQASELADQATTIDKTSRQAQWASKSLELLENTVDCILLTIQAGGRISYLNRYAESQLGAKQDTLFIQDITASESDSRKFFAALEGDHSDESNRFSCQLLSSDKTPITVQVNCKLRDVNENNADLICVAHDVTELLSQRDRLRRAEKFEALGEACARIAHDFANLLTIIVGNVTYLKGREVDEEKSEVLEDIASAANDSKVLTEQIGQYSSRQRIELVIVQLDDFMQRILSMSRALCPERVKIKLDYPFYKKACRIDETLVTSIVLNLIANASDAIEGDGSILIRVRLQDQGANAANDLTISIEDNGHGIAEEHLERITEPFFTTKGNNKGLGLGLSTVVRQIEAMEGTLKIESELGVGTNMTINLPVR